MVLGVSSSDLKVTGWNAAVAFGVAAGCSLAAYLVKELAVRIFAAAKPDGLTKEKETHATYSQYIGFALGLAAAVAVYKFVPASRFALSGSFAARFGTVVISAGIIGAAIGSGSIY